MYCNHISPIGYICDNKLTTAGTALGNARSDSTMIPFYFNLNSDTGMHFYNYSNNFVNITATVMYDISTCLWRREDVEYAIKSIPKMAVMPQLAHV